MKVSVSECKLVFRCRGTVVEIGEKYFQTVLLFLSLKRRNEMSMITNDWMNAIRQEFSKEYYSKF